MQAMNMILLLAAVVPCLAGIGWGLAAADPAAAMHPLETLSHNRDILRQQLDPVNGYDDIFDEGAQAGISPAEQAAAAGSCGAGYAPAGKLCGKQDLQARPTRPIAAAVQCRQLFCALMQQTKA
jgi:hypothetical protein